MPSKHGALYPWAVDLPHWCVTVDTNGYAPLFFPIGKALENKGFWQQGVQIELLAARTLLLFGESTLAVVQTINIKEQAQPSCQTNGPGLFISIGAQRWVIFVCRDNLWSLTWDLTPCIHE